MPESKRLSWADSISTEAGAVGETAKRVEAPPRAANDADGWEHYRNWISKAPAPRGRRTGIDPALCSWKGYRRWTEQVRRNWNPDADEGD